jgi:hypothetical protein
MKLNKFAAVLAASSMFASGAAMAEPFYINVNNFDTSPAIDVDLLPAVVPTDGLTSLIYQLGVNWTATSLLTDDDGDAGITVGDSVLDTGFGTVSSYLDSDANAISGSENNEGVGVFHQLRFSYNDLIGSVAFNDGAGGILAQYTSGTINVYNDNNVDGDTTDVGEKLLMSLNVFTSGGTVGNVIIYATVGFVDPGSFFFPVAEDWSSLTVAINARIDSNIDPLLPTQIGNTNQYTRTSTLDGSVAFNRVPEPGVLALLGIGLIGLGAARRAKKAA